MVNKKVIVGLILSSLVLLSPIFNVSAKETEYLSDESDDVYKIDFEKLNETEDIYNITGFQDFPTTSEKPNFDIINVTFRKTEGKNAVLSLEVTGEIEELTGTGLAYSSYQLMLRTTKSNYSITFYNESYIVAESERKEINVSYGKDKDDTRINFDFELKSSDETFKDMHALTADFNLSNFKYYVDIVPNPVELDVEINAKPSVEVGKKVDFSVEIGNEGSGPYSWQWDFGDDKTSTVKNPTHTYTSPGQYKVTVTIGDKLGNYGKATHTLEVYETGSGNGNGDNGSVDTPNMMIFLGVIAVIIIVGIAILFYVIKK
ncbi:MAG: PKD domain-containing protein [Candidatus Thermoplasmatota archaeon]